MKYFLELLDSYKHRSCCVTRIDEAAKADPNFTKRMSEVSEYLISVSKYAKPMRLGGSQPNSVITPGGQYYTTTTQSGSIYITDIEGTRESIRHDSFGRIFKPTERKKLKAIATMILGPDGSETQQKQKQKTEQTPEEKFPQVDFEAARKQAKKDAENLEINQALDDLVNQYDKEAKCRARLNIGALVDTFRPNRDKPGKAPSRAEVNKDFANINKNLRNKTNFTFQQSDITSLHKIVKDNYRALSNNDKGAACNFLNALNKFFNTYKPDAQEALEKAFIFDENLTQHKINLYSDQQNTIGRSIDNAENPDITKYLDFVLKGYCEGKEEQECSPPESLPEEQIQAVKDNMRVVVDLARKDKLNEEQKALLVSLIQLTDTKKIAVAGVNFSDSIILPDRGRAFLDLLKFVERKHDIKFDIMEIEGRTLREGADNTLIGTGYEYWHIFKDLLRMASNTDNPEHQKLLMAAANDYFAKVGNMCKSLQALKRRIGEVDNSNNAIPTNEHKKIEEMRKSVLNDCSELSSYNKMFSDRVDRSVRQRQPDYMVQVGKEVGKGKRADTVLGFNEETKARTAAEKSGLNPDSSVFKTTVGELLSRSPEYKASLAKAGLIGKGLPFDPDKEIWTFDEGLKTSSGKGSNAVTPGSAGIGSISEDIKLGEGSPWVANVANALGLQVRGKTSRRQAILEAQSIMSKVDKVESTLDIALASVEGTRESPGAINATAIMTALKEQNIDGLMLQKDPLFKAAQAYANALKKGESLYYVKNALIRAAKLRVLESELGGAFTNEDPNRRAGAAIIVGMTGGVSQDQSIQLADFNSDDQYITDHNSIAVKPLIPAIQNSDSVQVSRASDSFSISIPCPGGGKFTVRYEGSSSSASIGKTAFKEGCGSDKPALRMEHKQQLHLLGLLKSQLEYLHEIFR